MDTTALRCGQLGGYYLGDDVPCDGEGSAMGACCFENDSCLETSSCDCGVLGGTFYVDVSCSYVQCGSPAPQGACCHSEAETGHTYCTVTTKTDCLNADAYFMAHWLGDWTTCSDDAATQCAEPHGACCLDTVCIWALESACLASGGHWTASVSCAEASCTSCHADVNNDGAVGITDLLDIIDGWGWCP